MYRRSACLTSAKLLGLESLREASLDLVEKQRKKKTISSVFCYPELSKNKNIFIVTEMFLQNFKLFLNRELFDEVTFRRVRHVVTEIPRFVILLLLITFFKYNYSELGKRHPMLLF